MEHNNMNYNKKTNECNQILIGMKAPNFNAETTFGNCNLSDYKGKWCILFSHPGDFTPVCTTEFISFAKYYPEFTKRNCDLLGLSIDSTPSHLAWVYNIYMKTGIHIPFPIIADRDMSISKIYGMLPYGENKSATVRCIYIIDPNGIIKAIMYYPMTTGRCIPEILRTLDALQTNMNCNVATPANWMPGNPVIVPYPKTYKELLERVNNPGTCKCIDWYLCFKEHNNCYYINNNKNINYNNNIKNECINHTNNHECIDNNINHKSTYNKCINYDNIKDYNCDKSTNHNINSNIHNHNVNNCNNIKNINPY